MNEAARNPHLEVVGPEMDRLTVQSVARPARTPKLLKWRSGRRKAKGGGQDKSASRRGNGSGLYGGTNRPRRSTRWRPLTGLTGSADRSEHRSARFAASSALLSMKI